MRWRRRRGRRGIFNLKSNFIWVKFKERLKAKKSLFFFF